MDQSTQNTVKGIIEALLFVNERPITFQQIKEAIGIVDANEVKAAIESLKTEYGEKQRGMVIAEIAGGFQMLTNSAYAEYVRNFYKTKHKEKLSKPSLETLAIVAYKQPVTRSDVELIRGVNSDGVMAHLFNKELVKIVGRKDIPGRPYLYGTTKQFLEYFGLKSLEDLPNIEDFPKVDPTAVEGDGSVEEIIPEAPEAAPAESEMQESDLQQTIEEVEAEGYIATEQVTEKLEEAAPVMNEAVEESKDSTEVK